MTQPVHAAEGDTILAGVYVDDISLEGMTAEEAKDMMEQKVAEWSEKQITLIAVGGNELQITPADVGFHWSNRGHGRSSFHRTAWKYCAALQGFKFTA